MANTRAEDCNRQNPVAFIGEYSLADFTDNSNTINIALPQGAVITRGSVTVTDNSDAGTTDVLDVGYTGTLNAYKNDIDLKTAALTALVPTGYKHTSSTPALILTRVPVGTAATGLEVRVEFEYLVVGKGDLTQD